MNDNGGRGGPGAALQPSPTVLSHPNSGGMRNKKPPQIFASESTATQSAASPLSDASNPNPRESEATLPIIVSRLLANPSAHPPTRPLQARSRASDDSHASSGTETANGSGRGMGSRGSGSRSGQSGADSRAIGSSSSNSSDMRSLNIVAMLGRSRSPSGLSTHTPSLGSQAVSSSRVSRGRSSAASQQRTQKPSKTQQDDCDGEDEILTDPPPLIVDQWEPPPDLIRSAESRQPAHADSLEALNLVDAPQHDDAEGHGHIPPQIITTFGTSDTDRRPRGGQWRNETPRIENMTFIGSNEMGDWPLHVLNNRDLREADLSSGVRSAYQDDIDSGSASHQRSSTQEPAVGIRRRIPGSQSGHGSPSQQSYGMNARPPRKRDGNSPGEHHTPSLGGRVPMLDQARQISGESSSCSCSFSRPPERSSRRSSEAQVHSHLTKEIEEFSASGELESRTRGDSALTPAGIPGSDGGRRSGSESQDGYQHESHCPAASGSLAESMPASDRAAAQADRRQGSDSSHIVRGSPLASGRTKKLPPGTQAVPPLPQRLPGYLSNYLSSYFLQVSSHQLMNMLSILFITFLVTLGICLYLIPGRRDDSGFPWWTPTIAMLSVVSMHAMKLLWNVSALRGREKIILACLTVNTICTISYGTNAVQLVRVTDDVHGRRFIITRFLEWIFATPLLVLLIANLSDFMFRADRAMIQFLPLRLLVSHKPWWQRVHWVVCADVIMLTCGGLSSLMPTRFWCYVLVSISCVMFVWVMFALDKFLQHTQKCCSWLVDAVSAQDAEAQLSMTERNNPHSRLVWSALLRTPSFLQQQEQNVLILRALRAWVLCTWSVFPVVWFLSAADVLTDFQEEAGYFGGDIVAKVFLSAALQSLNLGALDQSAEVKALVDHEMQVEAHRKRRLLEVKQNALEMDSNEKDNFLRYVFHELRIPLNALILGVTDLFTMPLLDPAVLETVKMMNQAARYIPHLLDDVLSMQKITSDKYVLQQHVGSVQQMVMNALAMVAKPILQKNLTIDWYLDPSLPLLTTDFRLLRQVCANLLSNAIRYSNRGTQLTVSLKRVPPPAARFHPSALERRNSRSGANHRLAFSGGSDSSGQWTGTPGSQEAGGDSGGRNSSPATVQVMPPVQINVPPSPRDKAASMPNPPPGDFPGGTPEIRAASATGAPPSEASGSNPLNPPAHGDKRLTTTGSGTTEGVSSDFNSDQTFSRGREQVSHSPAQAVHTVRAFATPCTCCQRLVASTRMCVCSGSQLSTALGNRPTASPAHPGTIWIRLSVRDRGAGISASNQRLLFRPFMQIDKDRLEREYANDLGMGVGLGLSICKRIIELFNGRIGVMSALGEGSEFYFIVPLDIAGERQIEQSSFAPKMEVHREENAEMPELELNDQQENGSEGDSTSKHPSKGRRSTKLADSGSSENSADTSRDGSREGSRPSSRLDSVSRSQTASEKERARVQFDPTVVPLASSPNSDPAASPTSTQMSVTADSTMTMTGETVLMQHIRYSAAVAADFSGIYYESLPLQIFSAKRHRTVIYNGLLQAHERAAHSKADALHIAAEATRAAVTAGVSAHAIVAVTAASVALAMGANPVDARMAAEAASETAMRVASIPIDPQTASLAVSVLEHRPTDVLRSPLLAPASLMATAISPSERGDAIPLQSFDPSRYTLLLVDDVEQNCVLLKRLLERHGFKVDVLHDGAQAVELLYDDPEAADLVLMDSVMPTMDGGTATVALRRNGFRRPIVGLSGDSVHLELQQFRESGANAVISKPIDFLKLLTIIQELLVEHDEIPDAKILDELAMQTNPRHTVAGATLNTIIEPDITPSTATASDDGVASFPVPSSSEYTPEYPIMSPPSLASSDAIIEERSDEETSLTHSSSDETKKEGEEEVKK